MLHNVRCRNKCENVHYSFASNFFFNPICEKTRYNTLPIFLYFSKPLDLLLIRFKKKSKYKLLETKFKVKVKVQRSTL